MFVKPGLWTGLDSLQLTETTMVDDEIIIISSNEEDLVFVLTPMKRPASQQSDDECVPDELGLCFEPLPESMSCKKK